MPSKIIFSILLGTVTADYCYHLSEPTDRWAGGTCFETTDMDTCGLFGYPSGRCEDNGFPHKCIGNYEIAFWYKDIDCKQCVTPDPNEGKPCTSEVVAQLEPTTCYHLSGPSDNWVGGTCSETTDLSSCKLFNYPTGRCSDVGYPHKCIGNYDIPFWYKDEDCKHCVTPDTSEGEQCPSEAVFGASVVSRAVESPVKEQVNVVSLNAEKVVEAKTYCYHLAEPSDRFVGGTCHETTDASNCELFNYPAGRCSDVGYAHKCIGNYNIAFWYKDEDCKHCVTPDTNEGKQCSVDASGLPLVVA